MELERTLLTHQGEFVCIQRLTADCIASSWIFFLRRAINRLVGHRVESAAYLLIYIVAIIPIFGWPLWFSP